MNIPNENVKCEDNVNVDDRTQRHQHLECRKVWDDSQKREYATNPSLRALRIVREKERVVGGEVVFGSTSIFK